MELYFATRQTHVKVSQLLKQIQPPFQAAVSIEMNGRGERIRTSDLSVPNRALYQAEPRPDK